MTHRVVSPGRAAYEKTISQSCSSGPFRFHCLDLHGKMLAAVARWSWGVTIIGSEGFAAAEPGEVNMSTTVLMGQGRGIVSVPQDKWQDDLEPNAREIRTLLAEG